MADKVSFSRDDVVEVEVRPAFPVRLPRGGGDGVTRVREGVLERLLHIGPCPVRVRAWQVRTGVRIRAERIEPRLAIHFGEFECEEAGREQLEAAIERMRFALALDDDMGAFFRAVQGRPADRRRDPPQALDQAEAPALAMGGAGLGDHRAADRVLARGGDPEADGAPLGAARRARRRAPTAR